MIPIRDENQTTTTPYVVYLLIAINVLLFIIDQAGGKVLAPGVKIGGLWAYSLVPAQIIKGDPNLPVIMGHYAVAHPSPSPVWITVFTSIFLHGGLLHIGGNMLYLWIFGNNLEDVLGHFKFLEPIAKVG